MGLSDVPVVCGKWHSDCDMDDADNDSGIYYLFKILDMLAISNVRSDH